MKFLYVPELKRYTEFYSTSSADDLFRALATYGEDYAQEHTFDDEEYRASFKMKAKAGETPVEFSVSVLKVDDDKKCIEVIKDDGDKFEFYEVYTNLKKFFGGHANTTL